jgi:hypothetical protein
MAGKKDMQKARLLEQRDKLLAEIEALRNRVMGLEMAISLLDDVKVTTQVGRGRRSGAKTFILDLLRECGTSGLNAAIACEIGERRGTPMDRASVSSLLSRLKADGVVTYDGDRYRLADMPRPSDGNPFRVVEAA